MNEYMKMFASEGSAMEHCKIRNRMAERRHADRAPLRHRLPTVVVIDGPNSDYAVVDMRTAQDMGALYKVYY